MNSNDPFCHLIMDGFSETDAWPDADNSSWVTYDSLLERKRALNDWTAMPDPLRDLLARLLLMPVGLFLGLAESLVADTMLWGGGCHEMRRGDWLDLHLDSDVHPRLGLERRVNAVLFLSAWEPTWGGELEFWREGEAKPAVRITPARGRLVLFEAGDRSFHSVAPVMCPAGVTRRSLAVYWWGLPRRPSKRPRALFLPMPGEVRDPEKDRLRVERSN